MWLSLLLALLTFLLTGDGTKEGRRKALLAASVVGAGSAYVTSQTEWGEELNGDFNEFFGMDDTWTGVGTTGDGSTSTGTSGNTAPGNASGGSGGGIFSNIPGWVGAGAGVAAGATLFGNVPKWVWWAAAAGGVYLLLKD